MRRLKITKKWRRASLYKKSLILFIILLTILSSVFLFYVHNSMVIYERSLIDNYIKYLVSSGKIAKSIDNNGFRVSEYEKKNATIAEGLKKLLIDDKLEIKKNTKESKDGVYTYDLKVDNNSIGTVSLKSKNSYRRMAILTIDEWEVNEINLDLENGIYAYEINIPSNYKLYINNVEVNDSSITKEGDVADLEKINESVEIAKSKTYEINNLIYEPTIKIVDENSNEVEYKKDNNKISVNGVFKEIATLEEAKEYIKDDFDILNLAENYSLYLTDDLAHGVYGHGFNKLSPYLIKGSYMYEMAYAWGHQVDITFVSNHYLKNPIFTNESLKDFIIYGENAFSVLVHLEKNLVVQGNAKVDKMNDRLYFVYYEGGYKLVDMKSIKEG